jgi:hypothetical protein
VGQPTVKTDKERKTKLNKTKKKIEKTQDFFRFISLERKSFVTCLLGDFGTATEEGKLMYIPGRREHTYQA